MTEKEIKEQIKFHNEEIYKLKKMLVTETRALNVSELNKNDIIKLEGRKIDSQFKTLIEVEDTSHIFYKKKVVITGEFPSFGSRNDMAEMLQRVGADVNSSISRKTDFVIVGNKAGPKKLLQIEEFQIKTFSEHDFIKLF